MSQTGQPLAYAQANRTRFVEELCEFIRFPSVSAQPDHADDSRRCAAWLANHLRVVGLEQVNVIPTPGRPLVYAEWLHAPHRPTVLIYGHYDVQPAEPLEQWRSPPFEPMQHGNNLYGRGASDDKGQMFALIKALESYLRTNGRLPVNVKCLFEGEEEIGSPNLIPFLARNSDNLAADVALVSDMPIPAPNRPAITYAMRGALAFELEVTGPQIDLHAGLFGGVVHNPLQGLCEIIASLHDAAQRIAIPGFYDSVRPRIEAERAYMTSTGSTDEELLRDARTKKSWGERGYTLYERATLRPALTINGIIGGYQGAGPKAVIPARAVAKLGFRLVPDQNPFEIDQLVRKHIARITPSTIRSVLRTDFAASPVLVNRRNPFTHAAALAYNKGFGARPVFVRSGGTIPAVSAFHDMLGLPTVLMGFALPDDRMHAPNEKFYLPNFHRGIATSVWFLTEAGAKRQVNSVLTRNHRYAGTISAG
jgi:acetylornithine deacetylase/succinyl-diaminopimelate desuccinylase-like protein